MWPVPLAWVWTHYKIGKLNMWTLFWNVCINFLSSQIWKENHMLELNGKPSSVTIFSTDFSFQNLGFSEFIWICSGWNHLKINISPTFWIQILPNKFHWILLIKIFPTTPKAHSNSSKIFSQEFIQYSRTSTPQVQNAMKPSPCTPPPQSFPKRPRAWYEASLFCGSHK